MRRICALFLVFLLSVPAPAVWATPTQYGSTGMISLPSADTHQSGSICVGLWSNYATSTNSGVKQSTFLMPVSITLGLGSFVEAYGSYPNLTFNGDESENITGYPVLGYSDRGFANLGMKMRLLGSRSGFYRFAIDGQARRNISDDPAVDGLTDYLTRGILTFKLGQVGLHLNGGLLDSNSKAGADHLVYGGGLEYIPTPRLRFMAEYETMEYNGSDSAFDAVDPPAEATFGFQYFLSTHLAFSAAYGQGLSDSSPDSRMIIGLYTCQGTGTYIKPLTPEEELPKEEEKASEAEPVQMLQLTTLAPLGTLSLPGADPLDPVSEFEVPVKSGEEEITITPLGSYPLPDNSVGAQDEIPIQPTNELGDDDAIPFTAIMAATGNAVEQAAPLAIAPVAIAAPGISEDLATRPSGGRQYALNEFVYYDGQVIGQKVEAEPDYSTYFLSLQPQGDYLVGEFYHDASRALPVWIEGAVDYTLSFNDLKPFTLTKLKVQLVNGEVPEFKLHIGEKSEVFLFGPPPLWERLAREEAEAAEKRTLETAKTDDAASVDVAAAQVEPASAGEGGGAGELAANIGKGILLAPVAVVAAPFVGAAYLASKVAAGDADGVSPETPEKAVEELPAAETPVEIIEPSTEMALPAVPAATVIEAPVVAENEETNTSTPALSETGAIGELELHAASATTLEATSDTGSTAEGAASDVAIQQAEAMADGGASAIETSPARGQVLAAPVAGNAAQIATAEKASVVVSPFAASNVTAEAAAASEGEAASASVMAGSVGIADGGVMSSVPTGAESSDGQETAAMSQASDVGADSPATASAAQVEPATAGEGGGAGELAANIGKGILLAPVAVVAAPFVGAAYLASKVAAGDEGNVSPDAPTNAAEELPAAETSAETGEPLAEIVLSPVPAAVTNEAPVIAADEKVGTLEAMGDTGSAAEESASDAAVQQAEEMSVGGTSAIETSQALGVALAAPVSGNSASAPAAETPSVVASALPASDATSEALSVTAGEVASAALTAASAVGAETGVMASEAVAAVPAGQETAAVSQTLVAGSTSSATASAVAGGEVANIPILAASGAGSDAGAIAKEVDSDVAAQQAVATTSAGSSATETSQTRVAAGPAPAVAISASAPTAEVDSVVAAPLAASDVASGALTAGEGEAASATVSANVTGVAQSIGGTASTENVAASTLEAQETATAPESSVAAAQTTGSAAEVEAMAANPDAPEATGENLAVTIGKGVLLAPVAVVAAPFVGAAYLVNKVTAPDIDGPAAVAPEAAAADSVDVSGSQEVATEGDASVALQPTASSSAHDAAIRSSNTEAVAGIHAEVTSTVGSAFSTGSAAALTSATAEESMAATASTLAVAGAVDAGATADHSADGLALNSGSAGAGAASSAAVSGSPAAVSTVSPVSSQGAGAAMAEPQALGLTTGDVSAAAQAVDAGTASASSAAPVIVDVGGAGTFGVATSSEQGGTLESLSASLSRVSSSSTTAQAGASLNEPAIAEASQEAGDSKTRATEAAPANADDALSASLARVSTSASRAVAGRTVAVAVLGESSDSAFADATSAAESIEAGQAAGTKVKVSSADEAATNSLATQSTNAGAVTTLASVADVSSGKAEGMSVARSDTDSLQAVSDSLSAVGGSSTAASEAQSSQAAVSASITASASGSSVDAKSAPLLQTTTKSAAAPGVVAGSKGMESLARAADSEVSAADGVDKASGNLQLPSESQTLSARSITAQRSAVPAAAQAVPATGATAASAGVATGLQAPPQSSRADFAGATTVAGVAASAAAIKHEGAGEAPAEIAEVSATRAELTLPSPLRASGGSSSLASSKAALTAPESVQVGSSAATTGKLSGAATTEVSTLSTSAGSALTAGTGLSSSEAELEYGNAVATPTEVAELSSLKAEVLSASPFSAPENAASVKSDNVVLARADAARALQIQAGTNAVAAPMQRVISDASVALPAEVASGPIPQPGSSMQTTVYRKYRLPEFTFEFGLSELSDEGKRALSMVMDRLRKMNKWFIIRIDGHTDNTGSDQYNDRLAMERSISVAKHLVANEGLNPEVVFLKGFGERKPFESNATSEGRHLNRRIELLVLIPKEN